MQQCQAMKISTSVQNQEKMFRTAAGKPQRTMVSEEMSKNNFVMSRESVQSVQREPSSERKLKNISLDLKMEAETLNKWKLSTELRLHQAEMKSSHLAQTTKSQRQTILDLQLENDSISTRLQEEARYREELCQKHKTTGALCQIVKLQNDEIEQKVQKFEELSKEIGAQNDFYKSTLEELTAKYKNLNLKSSEMREDMKNKLASNEEEFRVQEKHLLEQLQNTEDDKKRLQRLLDECEKTMAKQKEDSSFMQEKLRELNTNNTSTLHELSEKESLLKEYCATIDTFTQQKTELLEEILNFKQSHETLTQEIKAKEALIQKYSTDYDILKNQEKMLFEDVTKLEQEKEHLQQETIGKDKLLQKYVDMNDRLKSQEAILMEEVGKLKEESDALVAQLKEKESLLQRSFDSNDKLKLQEGTLLQELTKLQQEKESLRQEMKEANDYFATESNKEKGVFAKEREELLTELQLKKEELSDQLKIIDEWKSNYEEGEKREEDLKTKNDVLVLELTEMQHQMENLSAMKDEVTKQADTLKEEKRNLQNKQDEYEVLLQHGKIELEEMRKSLQTEAKDHQTDKESLENMSRCYEKAVEELRELKLHLEEHNDQVKVLSAANKELQSALKEAIDEKNHTIKDYDTLLNTRQMEKADFEETLKEQDQCLKGNAIEIAQLESRLQSVLLDMKHKDAEIDSLKADAGHIKDETTNKLKALQRQIEHLAQSKDDEIKSWELKLHVANRTKEVELKALETDNLYHQQLQNQKTQEAFQEKEQKLRVLQEEIDTLGKENQSFKSAEIKLKSQKTEQDKEIKLLKEKLQALAETKDREIATLTTNLQTLKHSKEEEIKLLQQQRKNIQKELELQISELKIDKEELIQEKQRWLEQLEQQMQQLRPPPARQAPCLPPSPSPLSEQHQLKTPARKPYSQFIPTLVPSQPVLGKSPKTIIISEDEENGWNKMFSSSPTDESDNICGKEDTLEFQNKGSADLSLYDEQDKMLRHHQNLVPKQTKKAADKSPLTPKPPSKKRIARSETPKTPSSKRTARSETPKTHSSKRTARSETPKTPKRSSRSDFKEVKMTVQQRKGTPEANLVLSRSARSSTTSSKVSASMIQNSLLSDVSVPPRSKITHKSKHQETTPAASPKLSELPASPLQSDSSEYIEGEVLQRQLSRAGLQVGTMNKSPRTPRYDVSHRSPRLPSYDKSPVSSPQPKKMKSTSFKSAKTSPTNKPKINVRRADTWYRGRRKFFKTNSMPDVQGQLDSSWCNNADDIFKFPED